jgi:hypothetical protein
LVHYWDQITDLKFISDSVFVSLDGSKSINYWYVENKRKAWYSNDTLPVNTRKFELINPHIYLLIGNNSAVLFDTDNNTILDSLSINTIVSQYNPDNNLLLLADSNNEIWVYNIVEQKFRKRYVCSGHTASIESLAFNPEFPMFASTGLDASIKLWNTNTGELIVTIIPIGKNDKIIITPDNYYMTSKNNLSSIGFKQGLNFYAAEQFDIKYNRPDIVLERMGFASNETIEIYRKAYNKRLQKLGFTEDMFDEEWHTPDIEISNLSDFGIGTTDSVITLKIHASDSKYHIDRIHVYANNVPVYGMGGLSLRDNQSESIRGEKSVQLLPGSNTITVSCINEHAVESRKESFTINYQPVREQLPDLYVIAVSVSDYHDKQINLQYAVKDGRDMVELFAGKRKSQKQYRNIYVDTLFNTQATRTEFFLLRNKLLNTKVDDKVVVFFSGHGLLNKDLDFYFATTDVNFSNPEEGGISFDEIEWMLDSIPARRKLLLVDACHSGEVDKQAEPLPMLVDGIGADTTQLDSDNQLIAYNTKSVQFIASQSGMGMQNSFDIMKTMFTALDKGTGTVVISAAAGLGYAIESKEWKNGVFTYTIRQGLLKNQADRNGDKQVTISELKDYTIQEVEILTRGKQKPTARRENLDFDWEVW